MDDLEKQVLILTEQNKHLENKCNNIFDQLTEIRTTIQEIYGENHRNERFLCREMLKISQRLEEMAKNINSAANIVTVSPQISPQINPCINQNPAITSTEQIDNPPKEKEHKNILSLNDDEGIFKIGISAIVGFLALLGIISIFLFKLIYFITEMFN